MSDTKIKFDIYKDDFDGTEYEIIARSSNGDMCAWYDEQVFRRIADGALFFVADSGCSCNYFGDSGLDLRPVATFEEALVLSSYREALARSEQALGALAWFE